MRNPATPGTTARSKRLRAAPESSTPGDQDQGPVIELPPARFVIDYHALWYGPGATEKP
jgi:hypothetical protein